MKAFRYEQKLTSSDVIFAQSIGVCDYSEQLLTKLKPRLKPSPYNRKIQTYNGQIKPFLESYNMKDITYAVMNDFINKLVENGYSYSTIKKACEFMSGLTKKYRIQFNLRSYTPCDDIELPKNLQKESSETVEFYNAEEITKIVDESTRKFSNGVSVYRLGWGIVLLLYTGMRIGELLALKWSDVDFDKKTISITKNTQALKVNDKYILVDQPTPKTASSRRIIPLNAKAIEAIEALKEITGESTFIMTTKTGGRIFPRNFDRTFRNVCNAAKIPVGGVHRLRHTFASMLFRNGCKIKLVSELLGHSDTSITQEIYIHLIQEQKVQAIESLDSYLD